MLLCIGSRGWFDLDCAYIVYLWIFRMLTSGEDPLYIARRLIVVASEDVGLANNSALPLVCFLHH